MLLHFLFQTSNPESNLDDMVPKGSVMETWEYILTIINVESAQTDVLREFVCAYLPHFATQQPVIEGFFASLSDPPPASTEHRKIIIRFSSSKTRNAPVFKSMICGDLFLIRRRPQTKKRGEVVLMLVNLQPLSPASITYLQRYHRPLLPKASVRC